MSTQRTTSVNPVDAPEELMLAVIEDIQALEDQLRDLRAQRVQLGRQLLSEGMSLRQVGALASVSAEAVNRWKVGR